jgi:hypothetical protein
MEAARSTETSVNIYQAIKACIFKEILIVMENFLI